MMLHLKSCSLNFSSCRTGQIYLQKQRISSSPSPSFSMITRRFNSTLDGKPPPLPEKDEDDEIDFPYMFLNTDESLVTPSSKWNK